MIQNFNNRNIIVIGVITVLCFALSTFTVLAGSVSISDSVDNSDPFASLASLSGSSCSGSFSAHYDTYTFQVDTTGTYTIETTLGSLSDSILFLYSPSFDVSNPLNNCIEVDDDDGAGLASRITRNLTADTPYIVLVRGFSGALGTYTLDISGPGNICLPSCAAPSASGLPQPAFTDGRINNYDTAAPVAVYPHHVDGEIGLIIYDADGLLLLIVSPRQIADAPDNPDGSILIAEANGLVLYRIGGEDGGLWQINAPQYNGKTYVLIFPELFHSGGYDSYEID